MVTQLWTRRGRVRARPHSIIAGERRPVMAKEKQPVAKFRVGNVTASVFKNDDFFNTVLQKSYKDDDGQWQNTDSLGHGDLLNAAAVLTRAEEFIAAQ
jgi:hypothetical protein